MGTSVILDAGTAGALKGLGVAIAPSGSATFEASTSTITFPITKTGEADTGKMGYRTAWEAEVNLKRSDFGMTGMIGPIGDEVHLNISFEAVRS